MTENGKKVERDFAKAIDRLIRDFAKGESNPSSLSISLSVQELVDLVQRLIQLVSKRVDVTQLEMFRSILEEIERLKTPFSAEQRARLIKIIINTMFEGET